eukprot:TRINITY_DN31282_c0_g1_i1.p1 TRINITY_DN31282_c0_g1~~TRINITY_DN31282_c0_g1_i1.p1  ORF type:complete len:977 (-),score=191.11 TRINITY_DN31282_c0_g1_i1:30-2960(-)
MIATIVAQLDAAIQQDKTEEADEILTELVELTSNNAKAECKDLLTGRALAVIAGCLAVHGLERRAVILLANVTSANTSKVRNAVPLLVLHKAPAHVLEVLKHTTLAVDDGFLSWLAAACCKVLANFLQHVHDEQDVAVYFDGTQAPEVILNALQHFSQSEIIQIHGCIALGHLLRAPTLFAAFWQAGGLARLASTMRFAAQLVARSGVVPELGLYVGWVLAACCLHDDTTRDAILDDALASEALLWADSSAVVEPPAHMTRTQQAVVKRALALMGLREESATQSQSAETGSQLSEDENGAEEAAPTAECDTATVHSPAETHLPPSPRSPSEYDGAVKPPKSYAEHSEPDVPSHSVAELQARLRDLELRLSRTPNVVEDLNSIAIGEAFQKLRRRISELRAIIIALEQQQAEEEDRAARVLLLQSHLAAREKALGEREAAVDTAKAFLEAREAALRTEDCRVAAEKLTAEERLAAAARAEEALARASKNHTQSVGEVEERLAARERLLGQREQHVAELLLGAEQQAARLNERERQLVQRTQEVDRRAKESLAACEHREGELRLTEARLASREQRHEERENRFEAREASNAERWRVMERDALQREVSLRGRESECDRREQELREREKVSNARALFLDEREENVARLDRRVQQQIRDLADSEATVRESGASQLRKLQQQEEELAIREAACTHREKILSKREADLNDLEQEMERELAADDVLAIDAIATAAEANVAGRPSSSRVHLARAALQRSQQENSELRARIKQRYVERKRDRLTREYAGLCELERVVTKKARTFQMSIGKLCLFDVDTAAAAGEDSDFTPMELQTLFRAIRREKELGSELESMKRMRECPWHERHRYVTDAELIARMDVWWKGWLPYFDSRLLSVLNERNTYLGHSLRLLQKKRAVLPLISSEASSESQAAEADLRNTTETQGEQDSLEEHHSASKVLAPGKPRRRTARAPTLEQSVLLLSDLATD